MDLSRGSGPESGGGGDTVDGRNPANHLGCIKPCK